MFGRTALFFLSVLSSSLVAADVRLPALVGDHMVLQQNATVQLWGWADPGEAVNVQVSWDPVPKSVVGDAEGRWSLAVETPAAGGSHHLHFSTASNKIHVGDVLMGEVWVCGGQSNMEWALAACEPLYAEERASANHPNLRLFTVAKNIASAPAEETQGEWLVATPETLNLFSAVGFFFGRELEAALDVPIGLISCNWGGTLAEAWTSESVLRQWPRFDEGLDFLAAYDELAEDFATRHQREMAEWWLAVAEIDHGVLEDWSAAEVDLEFWGTMEQPNNWNATPLARHDGLVWFRRELTLPSDWKGQSAILELGPIDDMDTTWVNGVRVGGHESAGQHTTPRRYEIPAGLLEPGRNSVVVRVLDTGGPGGMTGLGDQLQLLNADLNLRHSLAGAWHYLESLSMSELPAWPAGDPLHPNLPSALYNGMLASITPYRIRGAIWYQGESNVGEADFYETLFPAMIGDWRARWKQGNFPFYFTQIAPYIYGPENGLVARLRDSQRKSLWLPNTGMAVTLDIGNPRDIHPKNKLDVGKRLSLWALAKTYGKELSVWSGPLYRTTQVEGPRLRVLFNSVGAGLKARAGGELTHFTLAGSDRVFHPATARIDGESVLVESSAVPKPVAVRFAWGQADVPNLVNQAGLPASSFRSDDW